MVDRPTPLPLPDRLVPRFQEQLAREGLANDDRAPMTAQEAAAAAELAKPAPGWVMIAVSVLTVWGGVDILGRLWRVAEAYLP